MVTFDVDCKRKIPKFANSDCLHVYALTDIAWCEPHFQQLEENGCDITFGTLELVERVNDLDAWDEFVDTDAEVDVAFGLHQYNPPVLIRHADAGGQISVQPLCCIIDDEIREEVYTTA